MARADFFTDATQTANNRDALWLTGRDESVEVNQRALVDKVLARYSGEFTVFRELLQNSDDARSSTVEIRFETAAYMRRKDGERRNIDVPLLPDLASTLVAQWTFRNNGNTFGDEDWTRLRKIAEGNPNEEKIGAFGVGFYSLFSVTEDPFVSSGGQGMQFYWKDNKDQLNVRRGALPSKGAADPWTTFEMTLREAGPLPSMFGLMRFLASSITFMVHLKDVNVYFDEHRIGQIRKSSGVAAAVDLPITLKSNQRNVMSIRGVQSHAVKIEVTVMHGVYATLAGTQKHSSLEGSEPHKSEGGSFSPFDSGPTNQSTPSLSKALPSQPPKDSAELHNTSVTLTVFTAEVDVNADKKLSAELLRSTKKNPPGRLEYHLIYTGKDEYDQSLADDKNQPVGCGSIFQGLRADLNGAMHTRIFIGHATGQTTGMGGHMASSFIPTVERESIDFVDKNIAIWNKELLYIGGFLSRAVYELELSNIHAAWASAAAGTTDPQPPQKLQIRLQERFLHTLNFFAFHHSTPLSQVGEFLEASFYDCSATPLRLLSSVGVREASSIKQYDPDIAKFLKDMPMLPESVLQECERTITMLQNQGMIASVTIPDVLRSLQQHQLNKEELVSCLGWWIGLEEDTSAVDVTQLLGATFFRNVSGGIVPLTSVQFFVDPRTLGGYIPQDSPLPTSLLPQEVTKQFSPLQLSSFGWKEFTVVDWLRYISHPDLMANDFTHDFTRSTGWAARVLGVLSRVFPTCSNDARRAAKEILASKTCIPTTCGLYTPQVAYLPGTSTGLFHDLELPIVQFPDGLKITGDIESLLSFIGVRKHIDPQLILERMAKTGNWNITGLLGYLAQVRKSLPAEEVTKLKSSEIFSKESAPTDDTRYRACDLYAPTEIFRELQLPVIQLDEESEWSDDSDEVKLLFHLGLRRHPPLQEIVDLCSSQNVAIRTLAFRYLCDNLDSKYSDYNPRDFGNVGFIPAENNDGNHLGQLGNVFMGTQWKALGFSVVQEGYRQAPTSELGIRQHPPPSMILSRLEKTSPPNEHAAREWFKILFEQISAFKPQELVALSNLQIVPTYSSGVRKWLKPTQCYLGEATQDDLHSRLFVFVDFGPVANQFLRACSSKNEPSVTEVAESLIEDPQRFYSHAGGHENFLTQLRNLAVNKQRIPNMTMSKMKFGPILLGKKTKGPQGFNHHVHELQSPKEIVIADDINAYQLFRDVVFIAPQEELLEEFYAYLGCKRLSAVVQEQCEVTGDIPNAERCSTMRSLVLDSLTIFLHEYTYAKPRFSVAWLSDAENFKVKICETLSVSKTLIISNGKTKRSQVASAGVKKDGQGRIELWLSHDTEPDMYEVATSLCRLLFGTAKLSESLLFTTILSTDFEILRRRGCNVDLILKRRQLEQDMGDSNSSERKGRATESEASKPFTSMELHSNQTAQSPLTKLEASKSSASLELHPPAQASQNHAPEPKASKSLSTRKRRHLAQSSLSRVSLPEGCDAMQQAATPPENPPHSNQTSSNQVRLWLRQLVPRGPFTTSARARQRVIPLSDIQTNINMAIKACSPEEGQVLRRLNNMEMIKECLTDRYCAQVGNLVAVGEWPVTVGVSPRAEKMETIKVFATEGVPNLGTFITSKQATLGRFVDVIVPVAKAYDLSMTSLNVFCDAGGGPIAFNRNGSLFLNLRYFEEWHDQDVKKGVKQHAQISWFCTLSHEIAHNLVKAHNSEHAFWYSAICGARIPRLVEVLGQASRG